MKLLATLTMVVVSIVTTMNVNENKVLINQNNDLIELNELAEKQNINISSWTAFQRKQIGQAKTKAEMMEKIEMIMQENSDYSWKQVIHEENHHYVWEGSKHQKKNQVREKLKIKSYISQNQYSIRMTYEIAGSYLNEELLSKISKKFGNEKNVFYSITGKVSGNQDDLQKIRNKLVSNIQAKTIEEIHEPTFVSLTAYSKMFESELRTKADQKINVQIGMRVADTRDDIDVTIGTPIITTEY